MSVHEKIRLVRQAKGFTQEEFAEKLGLSPNAYGDIERGDSDPKLSKLQKIADILEMDLSELLDLSDKTLLNINFNNEGKQHDVYMSSNSEHEKLKSICEFKDKEIAMYQQRITDLTKIIDVLEKNKRE
ncbi:MAG: helix-turn-helix transcriptional regulator [Methylococcales bacterium]